MNCVYNMSGAHNIMEMHEHVKGIFMIRAKRIEICLFLLGVLSLSNAVAQESSLIVEQRVQQQEIYVDENGEEQTRFTDATRVIPGVEIFYTVTYSNVGEEPAEKVTINYPVPNNMEYVDGTARGNNTTITFSVDDGNSFDAPDNLLVTDAEGAQKPASVVDYTHIRWVVGSNIAPGTSGTVQFSAVVE